MCDQKHQYHLDVDQHGENIGVNHCLDLLAVPRGDV